MSKFVYLYSGGQMAETPEARDAAMQAWGTWFAGLGDAVTDMGNPFGAASTVGADGSAQAAGFAVGGYSIISAASLADASAMVTGCPVFQSGGTVGVYEALAM